MSQPQRDLEDRIDDAVVGTALSIGRFVFRHAWNVADRVFKLVAWMLLLVGIGAVHSATVEDGGRRSVLMILLTLALVWLAAAVTSVLGAMDTLNLAITGHASKKPKTELGRIIVAGVVGTIVVDAMLVVLNWLVPIFFEAIATIARHPEKLR